MVESKDRPLISVCIPTYRGAAHLAAAIDSVLGQTLTDLELVIIDDNSPDTTPQVVAAYEDPRIRYQRNTRNLGPEGNWNRCLAEARGRYFKLLPQDDLLYPDTLQRQAEVLERDTEGHIALVFGSRNIIDAKDKIITRRGYPGGREGMIPATRLIKRCVRYGTNLIGEPGAVLFRKSLAEQIGVFDATNPYVIDLDYWFRLLAHGDAHYIAENLASFRVSPQSWSVAIGGAQDRDFLEFIARVAAWGWPRLSTIDLFSTQVSARLNKWLRLLFYAVYLNNRRNKASCNPK